MTAFILKVVASICMLFDHIGAMFPTATPELFRWIGRIAFPIYAYMIAQGCKHTRNINKYLLRLGIFALISEIPFDIAFSNYTTDGNFFLGIDFLRYTNVFYTLFLGVACVAVYEKLKLKKHQWIVLLPILFLPTVLLVDFLPPDTFPVSSVTIATIVMGLYTVGALCFAQFLTNAEDRVKFSIKQKIIPLLVTLPLLMTAGAFKADYDMFGVGLIFLLYLANPENKITRTIVLTVGVIYHYGLNLISTSGDFVDGVFVVTERTINQHGLMSLLFAFISVVLLFFYNGKQGPKFKWAFYIFYPAHIAVLATVWLILFRI